MPAPGLNGTQNDWVVGGVAFWARFMPVAGMN